PPLPRRRRRPLRPPLFPYPTLFRSAASRRPGLAGLGTGELLAHTERSSLPRPPRLMLLVCQQPAAFGGDVLLTDGRALHALLMEDRKSTRLNSSHVKISYAVFCLKK